MKSSPGLRHRVPEVVLDVVPVYDEGGASAVSLVWRLARHGWQLRLVSVGGQTSLLRLDLKWLW